MNIPELKKPKEAFQLKYPGNTSVVLEDWLLVDKSLNTQPGSSSTLPKTSSMLKYPATSKLKYEKLRKTRKTEGNEKQFSLIATQFSKPASEMGSKNRKRNINWSRTEHQKTKRKQAIRRRPRVPEQGWAETIFMCYHPNFHNKHIRGARK